MTGISARDLVVERGGRRLLDGVSLAFEPGELVGIVGPNGAGKSTLLRCLAGLVTPDAGEVRIGDRPLASLTARERAREIGFVPQRFEPAWDYSVREVLDMGAGRVPGRVAHTTPITVEFELDRILERRWSRLSGGERARGLLASVLVTDPPILLADEPGASLDIRHRFSTLARLHSYAQRSVAAVVLHEIDLALRFCDRLLVLDQGRIALDAPVAEGARSEILDRVFGVAFHRVPVGRDLGVPLPVAG